MKQTTNSVLTLFIHLFLLVALDYLDKSGVNSFAMSKTKSQSELLVM